MVKVGIVGGTGCAGVELLLRAKGVAGQVVQSIGVMFGFTEIHGPWQLPRHP